MWGLLLLKTTTTTTTVVLHVHFKETLVCVRASPFVRLELLIVAFALGLVIFNVVFQTRNKTHLHHNNKTHLHHNNRTLLRHNNRTLLLQTPQLHNSKILRRHLLVLTVIFTANLECVLTRRFAMEFLIVVSVLAPPIFSVAFALLIPQQHVRDHWFLPQMIKSSL
jgi:hypothetical protein